MSSKTTIRIRAPRDIMQELRNNFKGMRDADIVRAMYNTSLIRAENILRTSDYKRRRIVK